MLSRVILIGRIANDLILRKARNNHHYIFLTLAVNSTTTNKTDFIDCVAWESLAQKIDSSFKKGDLVVVNGTLTSRKDNVNNKIIQVVISEINYFSVKRTNQSINTDNTLNENDIKHDYLSEKNDQNDQLGFDDNDEDITFNFDFEPTLTTDEKLNEQSVNDNQLSNDVDFVNNNNFKKQVSSIIADNISDFISDNSDEPENNTTEQKEENNHDEDIIW